MSQSKPDLLRNKVERGRPISSAGPAIASIHKAITSLKVRGDGKYIDAKLDWANGEPQITIKWIGPTT